MTVKHDEVNDVVVDVDDFVNDDDVTNEDLYLRRLCVYEVRWCTKPRKEKMSNLNQVALLW